MYWIAGVTLLVLIVVLRLKKKGSKGNPIETIRYDGCLGFKIGDSKAFVEARIKHLKLSDKEDEDEVSKFFKSTSPLITAASGIFSNVASISFHFDSSDILKSILIGLEAKQCDAESLGLILINRITKVLGASISNTPEYVLWKRENWVVDFERTEGFYISIGNSTNQ